MTITAEAIEPQESVFTISYPSGRRWFVVRTNIKCEFRAELGVKALGHETFLPREKVWIRHARVKKEKVRPLFSRYFFVRFDPNLTEWTPIQETDGVESLLTCPKPTPLGDERVPISLPAGLVERLRGEIEVGCFDQTRAIEGIKPGDQVQVVDGPYRDFIGRLKAAHPNKRVDILLTMFGSEREIEMPLAWVRP